MRIASWLAHRLGELLLILIRSSYIILMCICRVWRLNGIRLIYERMITVTALSFALRVSVCKIFPRIFWCRIRTEINTILLDINSHLMCPRGKVPIFNSLIDESSNRRKDILGWPKFTSNWNWTRPFLTIRDAEIRHTCICKRHDGILKRISLIAHSSQTHFFCLISTRIWNDTKLLRNHSNLEANCTS